MYQWVNGREHVGRARRVMVRMPVLLELAEGRLYQPFPQIVDSGKAWWFVCPPSSTSRPKTRAFEEWLVEELSAPPSRQGRPVVASVRR